MKKPVWKVCVVADTFFLLSIVFFFDSLQFEVAFVYVRASEVR